MDRIKRRIYLGVTTAGRAVRLDRWRRAGEPGTLRVLMYHKVTDARPNSISVSAEAFEEQQQYLRDYYEVISLERVERALAGLEPPPPRAVLLTFDDGYADNREIAQPILEHHGHTAVIFPATAFVDRDEGLPHDARIPTPNPVLKWDDLKRMVGVFEIGSHGMTHRVLSQLSPADAYEEIVESKRELELRLNVTVRAFSFPKGSIGDFTPELQRIVQEAGYHFAFTTLPGLNRPGFDPFRVRRHNVEDYGLRYFRSLLDGSGDLLALKETRMGYAVKGHVNRWRSTTVE